MKRKRIVTGIYLSFSLMLYHPLVVYALTEAEVDEFGKETATGNVFIWFLYAIAFLKVSQKIDSFMSSLGINVGHTGGSMMAELMVAAKGITSAKNITGGGSFRGGSFSIGGNFSKASNSSFLSGGLTGVVSRQLTQSAIQGATGQGGNPISQKAFESSLQKGGDFANNVTSAVAKGNINYTGSMQGAQASQALSSYMGQAGTSDAPSYRDVEIGGGRITGTETSDEHPNGTAFAMYNAEQYMAPGENYDTVTTSDDQKWYRQYAADAVDRTPYMTGEGKIAYRESIVQKIPDMPKRKDRI